MKITDNYKKHKNNNPLQKFLLGNFYNDLISIVKEINDSGQARMTNIQNSKFPFHYSIIQDSLFVFYFFNKLTVFQRRNPHIYHFFFGKFTFYLF